MSDESRADRLRRRRRKQRDQQSEPPNRADRGQQSASDTVTESSTSDKHVESSETGESDERSNSSKPSKPMSVKDTQVGTYMYLPENQRSELDFRYKELNLAYERSFGDELEKNRHFYPLVVQAGLDALDGMDGEEIRDLLFEIE
ncbi:hypothetical protein SAMN05421858_3436 [Haladaptatus litoreus]|uniref:DUF8160 domain-containing protein n=1 Tax=Haladaptatus litoreus TaxID=553468 RepID=A0A1N7D9F2_9EURY|nr:hypothetical protein [Haladaptatus litoreus]SIR72448.1 hypothetical protein SAMN05421858_3436 [Haladaptatus litoreus]